MDTSAIRSFSFFLAIAGGVYYFYERDARAKEWESVNTPAIALEKDIAVLKSRNEQTEKRLEPMRTASTASADLEGEIARLEAEGAAAQELAVKTQQDLNAETSKLEALIELNCKAAEGKPLPEFKTESGEVINGATLKRATNGIITVEMKDGVRKFVAAELPPNIVDMFALNYVPHKAQSPAEVAKFHERVKGDGAGFEGASNLDAEFAALDEACIVKSQMIRSTLALSRQMERAAFAAAIEEGRRGDGKTAKKNPAFAEALRIKSDATRLQKEFLELRKRRDDLRRLKLDMNKKPS